MRATPNLLTRESLDAASKIGTVFGHCHFGGHLKIALLDGDVGDTDLRTCEIAISLNARGVSKDQLAVEWECLAALRRLDLVTRRKVVELAVEAGVRGLVSTATFTCGLLLTLAHPLARIGQNDLSRQLRGPTQCYAQPRCH